MLYYANGSEHADLSDHDLRTGLQKGLTAVGTRQKVLAVPPDITRLHSLAGDLTRYAFEHYGDALAAVLPALGTHSPMTDAQMTSMFGAIPHSLFQVHDWRHDVKTLGVVPEDVVAELAGEKVRFPWPAQVNRRLTDEGYDLILSIGQVVPHEVIGMANYNKNIFVGTGGAEAINKSHYLGAVVGAENIMGRIDTPVRQLLNYAWDRYASNLPVVWVLTVRSMNQDGRMVTHGLFIGDDESCYRRAAELAQKVNITVVDEPIAKAVVYLDPSEYKSTWLGNKSVYRTRMALADDGELIVLAPGLSEFGEDKQMDALIRKYGYAGTNRIIRLAESEADLQESLGAAAHLIHGSSDGRFTITYCPGTVTKDEIEGVGYRYADLDRMTARYNPKTLRPGYNTLPGGEQIYFVPNPSVGLWAHRSRFGGLS
jgi:nickel-dependent lactate racemase